MSLRVPIFFGAFPLSIKSSKHDVFLMLYKKIQHINNFYSLSVSRQVLFLIYCMGVLIKADFLVMSWLSTLQKC